ncbi:MAG: hypothetical protein J07HQW2_00304 [Haloquadratum walsbyi J07HQW2]|jgi:hypothetical protein|uniref:Uncharacterized protein n=1 Tax=Haloquadratum walsbyi J07HQW2 TaxID=1238425 RepID=U1NAN4_9EURY|nr:MAG: hypothetical protein J07HQW2_00304 [Haloquadratum walsbyi J07HQW2]
MNFTKISSKYFIIVVLICVVSIGVGLTISNTGIEFAFIPITSLFTTEYSENQGMTKLESVPDAIEPVSINETNLFPNRNSLAEDHNRLVTQYGVFSADNVVTSQQVFELSGTTYDTDSRRYGVIESANIRTSVHSISLAEGMTVTTQNGLYEIRDPQTGLRKSGSVESQSPLISREFLFNLSSEAQITNIRSTETNKDALLISSNSADTVTESYILRQATITNPEDVFTDNIPVTLGGIVVTRISIVESVQISTIRDPLGGLHAVSFSNTRLVEGSVTRNQVTYVFE